MKLEEYRKKRKPGQTPEPGIDEEPDGDTSLEPRVDQVQSETKPLHPQAKPRHVLAETDHPKSETRHTEEQPSHHAEAAAAESQRAGLLRFVVQEHHASRLHYDFRIELDGVLKSWAIPKGPSLNPQDKRLSIMAEDHPLSYASFEGVIPEGNYGAGSVIVWDQGDYHAIGTTNRAESEQIVRDGLRKGSLKFVLQGEKLCGEFALVRLPRGAANSWLFLKHRDDCASDEEVTRRDRSVVSNRTAAEVAAGVIAPSEMVALDLADSPFGEIPHHVKPMLATLVEKPFDDPDWLFEIKWDGYRAIAEITDGEVLLYSRNQQSFNSAYPSIVAALRNLRHQLVLDGEIVVIDDDGKANFQLLQSYGRTGQGNLIYYVFDLLHLDGHDLRGLPLVRRKLILREILPVLPNVRLSDYIEGDGLAFYHAIAEQDVEGIIGKRKDSRYLEGERTSHWVKVKRLHRQEAVIAGFTEPRGSRKELGALILGVYRQGELVYVGHTGGGMDEATLSELRSRLEPMIQTDCPFGTTPPTNAPAHWVRPEFVCEVSFAEWTLDGRMRHPIFLGLRSDKPPQAVRQEEPLANETIFRLGKESDTLALSIDGRSLHLTNQSKLLWPQDSITKRDLVDYYRRIAPVILPYLRDRPESLHRFPNGVEGDSFFQKNVAGLVPEWIETITDSEVTYLLCQDEAALVYLANLACIELNPWNSRVNSLDTPDYLVLDLDPLEVPFSQVVESAQVIHRILDEIGASGYCKTSGATGLHIYVPLGARYTYAQARTLAEILALTAFRSLPNTTSLERNPEKRQHRVYLDYLQNRRGATVAAPYSVRPRPGATVSTPLLWEEVDSHLDPTTFNMHSVIERIGKLGDIFQPVLGEGIDMEKCLATLQQVYGQHMNEAI